MTLALSIYSTPNLVNLRHPFSHICARHLHLHFRNWLAEIKLSLNINKAKYMVFHAKIKNTDGLVKPVYFD